MQRIISYFIQVYELHFFYIIIFTIYIYIYKIIGIGDIMFRTYLLLQGQCVPLLDVFVSWLP